MTSDVTDSSFEEVVLKGEGLILVDFWAPWCGPCHMLSPVLEEIGEEMKDKVKVVKVNTDVNQQTAMQYQIMSIPTVMIFKDGQLVEKFIGVQPKSAYVDAVEKHG